MSKKQIKRKQSKSEISLKTKPQICPGLSEWLICFVLILNKSLFQNHDPETLQDSEQLRSLLPQRRYDSSRISLKKQNMRLIHFE